jgi:SAM-dependent methyltransferase
VISLGYITKCRVCGSSDLKPFLDFGKQALANSLLPSRTSKEKSYPLALTWCSQCHLAQLTYTVNPKKLFSSYVWTTSSSNTAKVFSKTFYNLIISKLSYNQKKILDIGSNDGTFLEPFKKHGCEVLGVDPASNIAFYANKHGISTIQGFFSNSLAKKVQKEFDKFDVVIARNVLPHVSNTNDFVNGITRCLNDDGMAVIEFHYAKKIMDELHYDSIYHEHLCYFTLETIEYLLNKHHLYIHDVRDSPISGGSLIVYCRKFKATSKKLNSYKTKERNSFKDWSQFADRTYIHMLDFTNLIKDSKHHYGTLYGYGASARSSTLLNVCGVDSSFINEIADGSILKQGKYTSGTHIPIKLPKEMMKRNPKCICILAWNLSDEIISILRKQYKYKGKIIIPLPGDPRII